MKWGVRVFKDCKQCGKELTLLPCRAKKRSFCSKGCGVKFRHLSGQLQMTEEIRNKISETKKKNPTRYWLGKKLPESVVRGMKMRAGIPNPKNSGPNSNLWRGGLTTVNRLVRSSGAYRLWRKSIFERDNYTCVWCGQRGGVLNADHIKPFSIYKDLRLALDNGRTLCVECHRKTDTYAIKTN